MTRCSSSPPAPACPSPRDTPGRWGRRVYIFYGKMQGMPARKGVPMRSPDPGRVKTLVQLDPDVRAVLDHLSVLLNRPLAVVVEEFIRNAPKDTETGLPVWVVDRVDAEQLPGVLSTALEAAA